MKILVTGATGFVGNHVINYLLDQSQHTIIATSRDTERAATFDWFERVTYVPFTIGEEIPKNIRAFFHQPDLCIHLAWDGLPDFRSEAHQTTIYQNHKAFLSALIRDGLLKLSVTGTCLEYGMVEGELHETLPAHPTLSYPIGKNKLRESLEKLQNEQHFELDWIRLFYMYGQGQHPKSILAQLAQHIAEKKPVFNMSQGDQLRDYLPVEKIAEGIAKLALLNKGNGIINCCSGQPITIKKLVTDFIETHQAQMALNLGYYPYPDYEPFQFWGSTKKREHLLKE